MSRKPPKDIIRPLDPSDPASWDHPDNERYWLVLARELGRAAARREWERRYGKKTKTHDEDASN